MIKQVFYVKSASNDEKQGVSQKNIQSKSMISLLLLKNDFGLHLPLQFASFFSPDYLLSLPPSLPSFPLFAHSVLLRPLPSFQSETLHINPLHTLIPSTMCVSFGVMLPVGNPPNAIVFSYGHVQISDMVRHTHPHTHTHRRKVTCAFCTCSIKRLKSAMCQSCLM